MPDKAVYVGRGSRWGNPWRITPVTDHAFAFGDAADIVHTTSGACLGRFDRYTRSPGTGAPYWATRQYAADLTDEFADQIRSALASRDLACWCPEDQPCHADVLLAVANNFPSRWVA